MIEGLILALWAGMILLSCSLAWSGVAARPAFDIPVFRYATGVVAVLTAVISFAFWRTEARCRQIMARKHGRPMAFWEASLFNLFAGVACGAVGMGLLLGISP
jgi:hypothetical protein